MNANSERILRYLSELMDDREKIEFKKELETNSALADELSQQKTILENLSIENIEADERYFGSLIPKVRSRIEKPAKAKFITRLAFGLPTLVVVVIVGVVFFKSGFNSNNGNTEIVNQIIENIDDEIVSSKYISDLDLDVNTTYKTLNDKAESQEIVYDEQTKNKILAIYDYPLSDELLSVQSLSKEELTSIYSKIEPKNY
ncbi:MAG: hypothetical protein A2279_11110 [Stygiobacter sp. RIFOXYA12_FULL_38_9]|nr:MAG: hypothetical protein A2X62_14475 [Stygiobacter sp. GWC2_38_9]OGU84019.1 MAG: hypothetical protein A2279_11110 [Stygiobacter sp. RIFOXYA12_FULL_38_9]OGV07519.1 MAG: hypothetical protein A2299_18120 [Stygiobacter sp. RIFOXYB2_FULL_37_11]OGV11929.1 MAG: hypothetical protein A2237_08280 [Stygiobacter sp. RIFOXYA2_FULL_38_8]OGV13780.1 MAG: hypothetical protein A2440_11520 [Stygiobacter sp. RIFOXYC2_FULL_38_25]OGV80164.1 MAG: hypothetical protein A2X65_03470 [Stygiobacter sp. GWF2_38_21]RJQ